MNKKQIIDHLIEAFGHDRLVRAIMLQTNDKLRMTEAQVEAVVICLTGLCVRPESEHGDVLLSVSTYMNTCR